ncbi:hypothetical protein AB685_00465 [Bacillus sp. LL01]|uniref:hypothetical protein n=1 Tax=Bacillus sp. LL01 TaxID=1665556 RepID=UPI00064D3CE1|nr:hypothetical protein [Bacillus sp. LL01]KMJ59399.1 hypothetical protein AB685_00465 [Bacillus sp. LL01]
MLTQSDIEFMKANRAEMLFKRTVKVALVRVQGGGTDPYTGEPLPGQSAETVVDAVWKEVDVKEIEQGILLEKGDVKVSFTSEIDLVGVDHVLYQGVSYEIISTTAKGIGEVNRRECIARRTT